MATATADNEQYPPGRRPTPPMVWKRTWVDDSMVRYAACGDGQPVLFLHGWALGHHTYKGVIGRLAARGCRVYAPSLPGFGGTEELPASRLTLAGYAEWAASFLDAIRVKERVVVVGHSFGGGVAISFAYDFPERIRSLVLVNSIGGSAWRRGRKLRSLAERPLWDWGLHFPSDAWPVNQATKILPVVLEDFIPNLMRDPRSLWRVAQLARGADLRSELEELKARELPVTVLWGRRDGVIPRESFEAICAALGAKGQVVDGSHSWLLADPDRFSEVITNDLEVARRARDLEAAGPAPRRPRRRELPTLDP